MRHLSKEARIKIANARRGTKLSIETRAKISIALTGGKNPMYGKHRSEETISKIRMSLKGRGGHRQTEEVKAKISIGKKGKCLSGGHRSKLSARQAEIWKDPEYRANQVQKQKAIWTPEKRAVRAKAVKQLWQSPEYVAKQMRANNVRPNKAELLLGGILDRNFPKEWKYVGDGQLIIGGRCPDFTNVNGQKRVIELFGTHWHPIFDIANRKEHYKEYGFEMAIIWEDELDDEQRLVRVLKKKFGNTASVRVVGKY